MIGLSYYPFFHGTLSQMKANVDALATQFHKKIVIAETQYPWTLANGNSPSGTAPATSCGSPASSPRVPGQSRRPAVVRDRRAVDPGPGAGWAGCGAVLLGAGLDSRRAVGAGAGIGTPNANLTLFNSQGVALPSIGIFRNPAAVCQSYDPWDVPCVVGG